MSIRKNNRLIGEVFEELLRRRVLHIGGAYIAGAWLGAEILNFLFVQFNAADWAFRLLAIVFVAGFPVSILIAWLVQVQEDGTWTIDPARGDHKTVAAVIVLGVVITSSLSWWILSKHEPEPVYQPRPHSLAVLPFSSTADRLHEKAAAETLYRFTVRGLDQSEPLLLVNLGNGDQPEDLQEYGESLGVAALATGRIESSHEGNQVEVQLLDLVLGEITWSNAWPWDSSRIIETSSEITNGLLSAMALPVLDGKQFTGTGSRVAYEAFMQGERNATAWTAESLTAAAEDFQRAIDADPGYSQAYTSLAQCLYDLVERAEITTGPERTALEERARSAVDIAQKLDPESADVLSLIGLGQANRQMRIIAFERALELDPGHYMSYYRYAMEMKADGNLEEAERLINRAISLAPMSARLRLALADILEIQGRTTEAKEEREKAASFIDSH